jgi:hypothetical protein
MSIGYCLNCSGTTNLPFAMCQSLPRYDLRAFGRGEVWLAVDYTFAAAGAARAPINLWFDGGDGRRKHLPLVSIGDPPGRDRRVVSVEDACFKASEVFGSACPGRGTECTHCNFDEVCGAVTECGAYDLSQAWLQVAAEFCEPEIGVQSGTVTVHQVELIEPNCE